MTGIAGGPVTRSLHAVTKAGADAEELLDDGPPEEHAEFSKPLPTYDHASAVDRLLHLHSERE